MSQQKKLRTRYRKLDLALTGDISDFYLSLVNIEKERDSKHQLERYKKAKQSSIPIVPYTQGVYLVYPQSEDPHKPYVISTNPNTCTCHDFTYNCDYKTQFCKHLWKLKMLVDLGCIPPPTAIPMLWILVELDNDITYALEENNSSIAESLIELRNRISEQHWSYADYEEIYIQWRDIIGQYIEVE